MKQCLPEEYFASETLPIEVIFKIRKAAVGLQSNTANFTE